MKKIITLPMLLIILLVSGCTGRGEDTIEITQEIDRGEEQESTQAPQFEQPTGTAVQDEPLAIVGQPAGCTLRSFDPTPGPEQVTIFTPTDSDWITGEKTASMTIVEYGDFQ